MAKQVAVISDTHGYCSRALLTELEKADLIVHAGDICSRTDFRSLSAIAPLKLCLGNNDWGYNYGPSVKKNIHFIYEGCVWQVCHYRERLVSQASGIAVCGHTHKPIIDRTNPDLLVINPGSPTYPRGDLGPTMGWIEVEDGHILNAEIMQLDT